MGDSFTEVSSNSWFGRIKNSFGGALVGLLLFFGSFYLIWQNEGCAVKNMQALSEGAASVQHVEGAPQPSNNGKLVHISGKTILGKPLKDPLFGIVVPALSLKREVEMYQWQENTSSQKEKNFGGSETTTTTYTYSKEWSSTLHNSGSFKKPAGHKNPTAMKYKSQQFTATGVKVNGYLVAGQFIDGLGNYEPISENNKPAQKGLKKSGEWYFSGNVIAAKIGDYRIRWTRVPAGQVSLIGTPQGKKLAGYTASNGKTLYMAASGIQTADAMFASAKEAEGTRTWLMRLAGFACMFFGLTMIFAPLGTILDVVPFIGSIMRFGTGVFSFVIAAVFTLVTIAIAWIAHRPIVAIGLLAAGAAIFFYFWNKGRKK